MKKAPSNRGSVHIKEICFHLKSNGCSRQTKVRQYICLASRPREDFSFPGPRHTSKSTLLRFAAKRMMVSGVCRPAASSFSQEETIMDFFNSAIEVLQTLVVALGAGLGVWGVINLLEGYGNDNPGANAHVS